MTTRAKVLNSATYTISVMLLFCQYIVTTQHSKNQTSISCCRQTCAMLCITANVLQTKVDAQCDKLATKLS